MSKVSLNWRGTEYIGPKDKNGNPTVFGTSNDPCPHGWFQWSSDYQGSTLTCWPLCSEAYPNCPHIDKIRAESVDVLSQEKYGCKTMAKGYSHEDLVDRGANRLRCYYNGTQFTTTTELQAWLDVNGDKFDKQTDEKIMPTYCKQLGDVPPPDATLDETGQPFCSRFMSSGQDGDWCRAWASREPELADSAKQDYCDLHPDDNACACINRGIPGLDPNADQYRLFKGFAGNANDACWYAPCSNWQHYLIPSGMLSGSDPDSQQCADVCRQVVIIAAGNNVDVGQIDQTLNCTFESVYGDGGDGQDGNGDDGEGGGDGSDGGGGDGGGGDGGTDGGQDNDGDNSDQDSGLSTAAKIGIAAVGGVGFLLLLLGIGLAARSKPEANRGT